MKLVDFVGNDAKIWEISIKTVKFLLFFTKAWFSQNHVGTDFFFKNDAKELTFGPEVPLNSIYKSAKQIFEFLIFFGNMSKIVDKIA